MTIDRDHLGKTFAVSLSAIAVAISALAAVDTVRFYAEQPNLQLAGGYLATGLGLCIYPALLAACLVTAALFIWGRASERIRSRHPKLVPFIGTGLLGVLIGLGGLLVLKPWELTDDRYHLALILPVLGLAVAGLIAAIRRGTSRRVQALLALSGSACFYGADALVLPGQYPSFHYLAFFSSVATSAVVFAAALRSTWKRVAVVLCVALLSQLALLMDAYKIRGAIDRHGLVQRKLLAFTHATFDLDHDGHSALYGGGDCNDFDAAQHPGRCELRERTVDANCNGRKHVERPPPLTAESNRPRTERPDVYLIIIDALRSDGGVPGESLASHPGFATFRREGWSFESAYTPIPGTFYAMSSMNESRHWRDTRSGDSTLLTGLRNAGYDVQLWIHTRRFGEDGREFLNSNRSNADPFSVPPDGKLDWTKLILSQALAEANQPAGEPRFRWLHLLDVHAPLLRGSSSSSVRDRYRAEVTFVDAQLLSFYRALRATERGRQALVVIAADHGEGLGEHGQSHHGSELYDEEVRVPLYFLFPGQGAKHHEDNASLLDILPTLAGQLGLVKDSGWQGHDWGRGGPSTVRVLSAILPVDNWAGKGRSSAEMMRDGPFKLIYNIDSNVFEMYDLAADPLETHSVVNENPQRFDAMRKELAKWQDRGSCIRPLR